MYIEIHIKLTYHFYVNCRDFLGVCLLHKDSGWAGYKNKPYKSNQTPHSHHELWKCLNNTRKALIFKGSVFLSAPGRRKKRFFTRSFYASCFQADYSQITLMALHHQPRPDSFTLTSWFAILAAEHRTCTHCRRAVMLSQQLPSKGTCTKLTISCHGGTYPREPCLMSEQEHSGGIKQHWCWSLILVPALSWSL